MKISYGSRRDKWALCIPPGTTDEKQWHSFRLWLCAWAILNPDCTVAGEESLEQSGLSPGRCPVGWDRAGVGAGDLGWGGQRRSRTLKNNAFGRNTHKDSYIWGCPSIGSRCHVAGQGGKETAASQWPLVQCIYNSSMLKEGRMDSKSLTARKHTLKSTDRLCKPVPNQESSNSFSYLVWGIFMDCMTTLG